MFKPTIRHKQFLIYVVILLIGIELGITYSSFRHPAQSESSPSISSNTSSSPANPTAACRDPAAVAVEPAEETLTAPQFMDPGVLRSTVHGWIHVRWKPVKGAKAYNVRVWNEAGVEVKNFETYRTFSFLKKLEVDPRLKETRYSVVVTPLGDGEMKGKPSDKKFAAMMPLRNLEPPTIKSIQTEVEGEPGEETPHTEIKK